MKRLAAALTLALAGAFATSANAVVIIDDFGTGVQNVTGGNSNTAVASGAVGGYRTLAVAGNVFANAFVNGSVLAINNASSGGGTVTSVTWNANGAGLGGLNLVEGVNDALQLNVTKIDVGSITVTFAVKDIASAGGDTATLSIPGLVLGNQGFLFTAFANYAAVDFTKINEIVMTIDAAENVDVEMNVVLTRQGVPVPGTLALFGAGLIGAAVRRRKLAAA